TGIVLMSPTTTGLLLEATGVSKSYGAGVALKSASLAVEPGEVDALMGANGAGKSTLVKILTGAVRPDSGRIAVRGRERTVHSPAEARRGGLVSVYQEPSIIPDLDIRANLRLIEIAAVCDRATVLREGETVGVVDVTSGTEERIVELMLGAIVVGLPERGGETSTAAAGTAAPRLTARGIAAGQKLQDASFE